MSYRENPITPTVGRIVLVRGTHVHSLDPHREMPAIVTGVIDKNTLTVEVFGRGREANLILDVDYRPNLGLPIVGAGWRWMDYQVQADKNAKAAALPETQPPKLHMQASPGGYNPGFEGSFGWALAKLKDGLRLSRAGWNGKGMWLYLVPAVSYPAQTEAAKEHLGPMVPYRAYIAMKTVDGDVVLWVASQTDILAEDWHC